MGREIDRLVATRVMGRTVRYADRYYDTSEGRSDIWSQHNWYDTAEECKCTPIAYWKEPGSGDCLKEVDEFAPSSDIASAWEVVEKMNAEWCTFRIQHLRVTEPPFARDYWAVGLDRRPWSYRSSLGDRSVWAEEATAPIAISLAALRACGVPESEIQAAIAADKEAP